jgi:NAD(P)H-nitrite reductase large subunit
MKVIVIGTGPAGITAAVAVRSLDPTASVIALSSEPYPPYSPPAMADHFLTGRSETLYWKGVGVATRLGIEERREVVVEGVDTGTREVVVHGGERIGYDRLIVASGSRLYAPLPGAELPGVFDFKSLRTATELVERVRHGEATTAAIVGAGLIGMELALLLADLGADVTVLEREGWVMPRVLEPVTAEIVAAAVRQRGVTLRLGTAVQAFVGGRTATGLRLGDGSVVTADLYVAATGVKPHTEFLDGSGIAAAWGIQVDDRLRTSAPGVFAAGDVAETYDRLTGERFVHAIFPNAVAQGPIAAANALGLDVTYAGAEAMNSLKHLGIPVVAMGTTEGHDEVLRHREAGSLCTLFLRDGRIMGAQLAGDVAAAGLYHSLVTRRADVRRFGARLVTPGFSMATLVADASRPEAFVARTPVAPGASSSAA